MSTRTEVLTRTRARVDLSNSNFCTDDEILVMLESAFKFAWDLVIQANEDYCTAAPKTFTLAVGTSTYDLSATADFYKVRKLERLASGKYYRVPPHNLDDVELVGVPSYRIYGVGPTLVIEPGDMADGDYRLWYVGKQTWPTGATSTMPDINGWVEEYVIAAAGAKILSKKEDDPSILLMERDAAAARIATISQHRSQSGTISDVRAANGTIFYGRRW